MQLAAVIIAIILYIIIGWHYTEHSTYSMEHFFELPVSYQGEELTFNGRLVTFGYSYKFYIVVNGEELVFEKDDNGDYRVLAGRETKVDGSLLGQIIEALQKLNQ